MILTLLASVLTVPGVHADDAQQPATDNTRHPRLVIKSPPTEQQPAGEAAGPASAKPQGANPPVGSGIHLFPPPGTNPPKPGIVVPEDFELPAGYVRHYQTTDDGQSLRAILMFHPDYDVVDEHGTPIVIPEDRVVPAAMAPPGLPIERLVVPTVGYPTPPTKGLP